MKVVYLSHVDSRWIKQRPQFLAEALHTSGLQVTYACSSFVRRSQLVSNQSLMIDTCRLLLVPQSLRHRMRWIDRVASTVAAWWIAFRLQPEALIVTHARHLGVARALSAKGAAVYYDCMDLNLHFADATSGDVADEGALVALADAVFCSSDDIGSHIRELDSGTQRLAVRNALHPDSVKPCQNDVQFKSRRVGYVGTISTWFDMASVLALLDSRSDVVVELWGPADIDIPSHPRLRHHGVVDHDTAMANMRGCSVLIMPFLVTPLIRGVDPVKVYEYVATGRPVVTCDYPQLDHFGSSIVRANGPVDFVAAVLNVLDRESRSRAFIESFVASNSWESRANIISDRIVR